MKRTLRVLIVEDDPADAELIVRELRRAGYEPEWERVDNEPAFRARLRPELDIILSDFAMPQFTGLRALEVLREGELDIPFILISGTIGEDTAVAAMQQGAADYLLKDRLTRLGLAVAHALDACRLRRERRQAEAELRETEQRFRESALTQIAILNALPAHIALLDAQGVILSVNEAWRRFATANVLQGPEFGVGQNYLEVCVRSQGDCSKEAEEAARGIRTVLRGEVKEFVLEYPCHSPAEKRWFRLMVTPLQEDRLSGAVVMHVNVTERKLAEETLRESEERFRQMAENSGDVFWMTDTAKNQVLYVSPAYEKIWGRTCESLYAEPTHISILNTIHPEDHDRVNEAFSHPIEGSFDVTYRIVRPEGVWRWIHHRSYPVKNEAGEIYRLAGIAEDITVAKEAEEALIRAHEELEARVAQRTKDLSAATAEAERANRAKSEFLSRMSHELRTPLHAILGFAQLLEVEGNTEEEADNVAQIIRAGNHLLGLINEVLDIARVEAGKLALTPEPVGVRDTLEEALSLVKPLASQRGVRLEPPAGDLDCEVLSSALRFKQVMVNLLSNAVKYNVKNGAVSISCQKVEDRLRIKVADTGRGISVENMSRLFQPFERLEVSDTVVEGAGLGLSLSKHLIEMMGGKIGVKSTVGSGSTFWVELPLVPSLPQTARPLRPPVPDHVGPPDSRNPRTLLYIEDNLSNLRLVERILERRPEVTLISAMQGSIGLELAQQHQPDVILLDLHLPDLSGEEVLRRLRADPATSEIPVVMISADATAKRIHRLREAGAEQYLTKPIDVRQFLAVVDAVQPRSA